MQTQSEQMIDWSPEGMTGNRLESLLGNLSCLFKRRCVMTAHSVMDQMSRGCIFCRCV